MLNIADLIKERLALSEKPHVVIATPGRLAEHLKNGIENWFSRIKFLVLDEADRLLSDCFRGDLKVVLAALPPPSKRQTLLFTATLDAKTAHIAESKKDKIELIETSDESPQAVVAELETFFVLAPRAVKECYLFSVLTRSHLKQSVIVFVARKKVCELLTETLIQLEVEAVSLNSDLSQAKRLASLGKFRAGKARVLVCTDLAARGLDIPEVGLVVNYNVPRSVKDYIHRVGRTARAKKRGIALTIVTQYETEALEHIEAKTGKKIDPFKAIEPEKEILKCLHKVSTAKKIARLRLAQYAIKNNF
ncbi:putative ATP-dependent RNA helicase ddx49, variant 2 [Bonamia ostreae]|uniref:ATP-dependent RNA helicase ddx49, variant 2 n=1 Tax=Bonamia ostreae TaxID=126728 RepID=A0ABV2APD6_9EUKA